MTNETLSMILWAAAALVLALFVLRRRSRKSRTF